VSVIGVPLVTFASAAMPALLNADGV